MRFKKQVIKRNIPSWELSCPGKEKQDLKIVKCNRDSWKRVNKLIYAKRFDDGVVGIVVRESRYTLCSSLKFPTTCISKNILLLNHLPQKDDYVLYGEETYYNYKKGIIDYDV